MAQPEVTLAPLPTETYVVDPQEAEKRIGAHDSTDNNVHYTGSAPAANNVATVSAQVDFYGSDGRLLTNAENTYLARNDYGLFYTMTNGAGTPVDATTTGGRVAATLGQDITFDSDGDGDDIMETYRGEEIAEGDRYARVKITRGTTDADKDGIMDATGYEVVATGGEVMTVAQLRAIQGIKVETNDLGQFVRYRFTEVRPPEVEGEEPVRTNYEETSAEREKEVTALYTMDPKWAFIPLGDLKVERQDTIAASGTGRNKKPEHIGYKPDNPATIGSGPNDRTADERAYVSIPDVMRGETGFPTPPDGKEGRYETRLPPAEEMRRVAIAHLTYSRNNGNPYGIPNGTDLNHVDTDLTQYIPGGMSVEEWYAASIAYNLAGAGGLGDDEDRRDYVATITKGVTPEAVIDRARKDYEDGIAFQTRTKVAGATPPATPGSPPPTQTEGTVPEDPYKAHRNTDPKVRLLTALGVIKAPKDEATPAADSNEADEAWERLTGEGGKLKGKSGAEILALARVAEEGGIGQFELREHLLGKKPLSQTLPLFDAAKKDDKPDSSNPDADQNSGALAGRVENPGLDASILNYGPRGLHTIYQPRLDAVEDRIAETREYLARVESGEETADAATVTSHKAELERLKVERDTIYGEAREEATRMADALRYHPENLTEWGLTSTEEEIEKARAALSAKEWEPTKETLARVGEVGTAANPYVTMASTMANAGIGVYNGIAAANTARDGTAVNMMQLDNQQQSEFMARMDNHNPPTMAEALRDMGADRPQGANPAEAAVASMQGIIDEVTGTTSDTGPNAGKTPEQVEQEREAATQNYLAQLNEAEQRKQQEERKQSRDPSSQLA